MKQKIRLIIKRNELIKKESGEIIAVITKHETMDYELKSPYLGSFEDDDRYKYEIVSAEFI